jgi:hypothetical protein
MAKSAKSKKPKSARRAAAADPRGLPGGTTTPPLRDPRLKKIWVYSEGTFVLHNASEIKKLVIATKAFDVSGWIDLSKMQPGGNTIFTEVRVSFANRSNVLYQRSVFSSPQLISLGMMTNGLNYLSGNHIEIWVQQTTSFDNFAKPIEYAYQFVVESQ